jgi:hypothetical protein
MSSRSEDPSAIFPPLILRPARRLLNGERRNLFAEQRLFAVMRELSPRGLLVGSAFHSMVSLFLPNHPDLRTGLAHFFG